MNILKTILLVTVVPTGLQAFTLYNRSLLPVIITQVVIQMHDGDSSYQTIEPMHVTVNPEQSLSLDRTNIAGLQFTFNNNTIVLAIARTLDNAYVTIEQNNAISPSQHVTITSQEPVTPTTKATSIGPRLA